MFQTSSLRPCAINYPRSERLEEVAMKIRLVEYKEGVPKDVHEEYDPKSLDIEFVDLKYTQPLELSATIEKGLDVLTFRGNLTSQTEHICGRCLKRVKSPVDQPFELFYETKGKDVIDTTDDLREALILDHPISFVCQENCKGLCPHCGVNRNETQCNCAPQVRSQAFSQLKKIWSRKREE